MTQSTLEILFPPSLSPTDFLSRGCLFGKLSLSPPNDENPRLHYLRGTLQINEFVYLDVFLYSRLWLKLSKSSNFNPDNAYLWRVFFRTTKEGKLCLVELIRNIPVEEHLSLNNPPPPSTGVDQFYVRGEVRYSDEEKVVLQLRRNQKPPKGYEYSRHWKPFLITVSSSLPFAQKGDFWDLSCVRKGECLVIKEANLIEKAPSPKKSSKKKPSPVLANSTSDSNGSSEATTEVGMIEKTPYVKKPAPILVPPEARIKSDSNHSDERPEINEMGFVEKIPAVINSSISPVSLPSSTENNTNSSTNNVIMITGKQAEITVKFTTRPELPEVGKTVTLEITTEQGFTVRANVNRKTFKKQVEKMDTFADWIAALSGKISRIDPNGVIELETASVAVFEKKPKEEVINEVEGVNANVEV